MQQEKSKRHRQPSRKVNALKQTQSKTADANNNYIITGDGTCLKGLRQRLLPSFDAGIIHFHTSVMANKFLTGFRQFYFQILL